MDEFQSGKVTFASRWLRRKGLQWSHQLLILPLTKNWQSNPAREWGIWTQFWFQRWGFEPTNLQKLRCLSSCLRGDFQYYIDWCITLIKMFSSPHLINTQKLRVKLHCIEMKLTLPAVSCVLEKVVFAIKQNVGTVAKCGAVI